MAIRCCNRQPPDNTAAQRYLPGSTLPLTLRNCCLGVRFAPQKSRLNSKTDQHLNVLL